MTTCGHCGAENPADHAFCSNCGSSLALTCPSCGTENAAGHKFCFNCGTALGSEHTDAPAQVPPTSDAGERRLVSVLFADLVSYTTLSEATDPEDIRSMLTTFYDRCKEIVARFGGVTDKFIGDAVMGVWGAVAAHEDDAERATRAALELVDMVEGLGVELGIPDLAARAGVLSGEASVGSGGNDHGLVVGDLVNTASRLQSIAPPGKVYVGQATRDLVGSTIEFSPAGTHELKGKANPVDVFEAVRVLALSALRRGGDLAEGPFVGRDDELRMLKDQLHSTEREGRARMVGLIGEAGIGKTRLSQELLRYIDGITEDIYYHSGRSPSYGDGVTLWALGEMIRQRAGILEGEDPSKSRLKLRTAVAEFARDEEEQRWIEPRLAAVIGIADMPPGERSELYAALRTFFQRIAERGTVLMVFEDLHWADDGLLDFIEDLVERTTSHPIMVLTLARPDLIDRRHDWGASRRRSLVLHLARLDDGTMVELVRGLAPGLPDEVARRIAERTAGVPLHAVEFVRMLRNSDQLTLIDGAYRFAGSVDDLAIPDSVSAIIGARLDRLAHEETLLIQDASVLGVSFTLGAIADLRGVDPATLEPVLRTLVRHDVLEVDEDPRSPEQGQYRFVQGLIREVAYGRLSRAERVARHLDAARRFEAIGDPELAGVVASHYASAVTADPGNEALVVEARDAVIAAAERSRSLHSNAQAAALYEQAISMTTDETDAAYLRLAAADAVGYSGRADLAYEMGLEVLAHFRSIGDTTGEAKAVAFIAFVGVVEFGAERASDLALPVYDAMPVTHDPVWVDLGVQTSRVLMLADRNERAIEIADEVLPVAEALNLPEQVAESMINRATALGTTGRWFEAVATLRGLVSFGHERDMLAVETRALNNLMSIQSGDVRTDWELIDRIRTLTDRVGAVPWMIRVNLYLLDAYYGEGDIVSMLEVLDVIEGHELSEVWKEQIELARLSAIEIREGYEPDRSRRIRTLVDNAFAQTDIQGQSGIADVLLLTRMFAGDIRDALDVALEVRDSWSILWDVIVPTAAVAAGVSRDLAGINAILDELSMTSSVQRFQNGAIAFAEAVRDALAGDADRALARFQFAEAVWLDVGTPLDVARLRATMATVLPDVPEALEAGAQARAFFETQGLRAFLDLFAAALPEAEADVDTSLAG